MTYIVCGVRGKMDHTCRRQCSLPQGHEGKHCCKLCFTEEQWAAYNAAVLAQD